MSEPRSMSQVLHPLDYPIWSALTTRQRSIAEGNGLVWRYPSEVAPFAATVDLSAKTFTALLTAIRVSDRVALFTPEPYVPPDEFEILVARTAEQMVGAAYNASADALEMVLLGPDDVPSMMELTELTKPGPFSARTHELGTFFGIRLGNQLAAMAESG
jgi:hypothetical protein